MAARIGTGWPDEEKERLKTLVMRGLTFAQIEKEMPGRTHDAIRRQAVRMGLKSRSGEMRLPGPKETVVRRSATILEAAIDRLRTQYSPVCAMDTLKRPSKAPEPYSRKTLFRVGGRLNVTAAEVMAMANELRSAA